MDNLQETLLIGGEFDGNMIEFDQEAEYITLDSSFFSQTYNRQTIKCGGTEIVVLVAESCRNPLKRLIEGYLSIL